MSYSITDVMKLAESLYLEAMRSGERERRNLPVGSDYWEQKAREALEARRKAKA